MDVLFESLWSKGRWWVPGAILGCLFRVAVSINVKLKLHWLLRGGLFRFCYGGPDEGLPQELGAGGLSQYLPS